MCYTDPVTPSQPGHLETQNHLHVGTPTLANEQKEVRIMANDKHTVDITTCVGTISFPHLFPSTASKNDKGETTYDVQIIIPKSDREGVRNILKAIREVGIAKWGDPQWKKVRNPLRDGDKEKDDLTESGKTKGEQYPERLDSYFINARTTKPVGVVDRRRVPITEASEVYSGCKGKIAVTFYPYSQQGNHGIGCSLNGVQKVADGEPIGGGGRPSVESMFDLLDDEDDFDLDDDLDTDEIEEDEVEEAPKPAARKATAKKAAPAAKKAASTRRKAPEPEPLDEDDLDEDEDEDEDDDEFGDLDDLDED